LGVTVSWFFATGGWLPMLDIHSHNWLTISLNLGVFGYCSLGLIALMLTITCLDEPLSASRGSSAQN
jgi:hypothetical protein